MQFDSLGDRMKFYEDQGRSWERSPSGLPLLIRLDGRAFHTYTRGLPRPFCEPFNRALSGVAMALAKGTNARAAYTQSDEISLVLMANTHTEQIYFDGRRDKINSVLASECTWLFSRYIKYELSEDLLPTFPALFDCRCWTVPSDVEATNYFIWREEDAVRNSIQACGQANFSHKELQGKSCRDIIRMLAEKDIDWHQLSARQRRGVYIVRHYEPAEDGTLRRHYSYKDEWPYLKALENRVEALFNGEDPLVREGSITADGNGAEAAT